MPYLFSVEVKESPIDGKGVFALEDIPENAVLWVFQSSDPPLPVRGCETKPNKSFTQQELQSLPSEEIRAILHGGFYFSEKNIAVSLHDGSQFTNHSSEPNSIGCLFQAETHETSDMHIKALRLIKKGEEIVESYFSYLSIHSDWMGALSHKYCPEKYQLEMQIKEAWTKGQDK